MNSTIVIGQFSVPRRTSPPLANHLSSLFSPKYFRLICKIRINFNFEREFHRLLREIGEINVFVNTQAHGTRYLQLDGFFRCLLHLAGARIGFPFSIGSGTDVISEPRMLFDIGNRHCLWHLAIYKISVAGQESRLAHE